MKARNGLHQLKLEQIYCVVGRADWGNEFSDAP